jgi:hypothetical protein
VSLQDLDDRSLSGEETKSCWNENIALLYHPWLEKMTRSWIFVIDIHLGDVGTMHPYSLNSRSQCLYSKPWVMCPSKKYLARLGIFIIDIHLGVVETMHPNSLHSRSQCLYSKPRVMYPSKKYLDFKLSLSIYSFQKIDMPLLKYCVFAKNILIPFCG